MSVLTLKEYFELNKLKNNDTINDVSSTSGFIFIDDIKISKKIIACFEYIRQNSGYIKSFDLLYNFINFGKNIFCSKKEYLLLEYLKNDIISLNIGDDGKILIKNDKQTLKIGKFLSKISEICDFDDIKISNINNIYEHITDLYKSYTNNIYYKFLVLNGNDILKGYSSHKYSIKYGVGNTLHKSCMNDKFVNLYLYINNPNKVSLLVLIDQNNNILGRSLLWKLDKPKKIFLDRIYSVSNFVNNIFIDFAQQNKWLYRSSLHNMVYEIFYISKSDNKYHRTLSHKFKMKVKLNIKNIHYYPYMDSLYIKKINNNFQNYLNPLFTIYQEMHSLSCGKLLKKYIFCWFSPYKNPCVP